MAEKKHIDVDSTAAEIRFEPSGREGLVAEGTYLSDAANRLGIFFEPECGRGEDGVIHGCTIRVLQGAELLSAPTQEEIDNLSEEARVKGERYSCSARIEREGTLVVEILEKEEPQKDEEEVKEERFQEFRKEFSELTLNQKVGKLVQLEAITLGDTFSAILNLPYTIGDQVMGVMAGFGLEMDKADREAKRPKEHAEASPEAAAQEDEIVTEENKERE